MEPIQGELDEMKIPSGAKAHYLPGADGRAEARPLQNTGKLLGGQEGKMALVKTA
jgi:hypothetical protein